MSSAETTIEALFNYRIPPKSGEAKPSFGKNPVDPAIVRHREHPQVVRNGRAIATSLDVEGFQLASHTSEVQNFYDSAEVQNRYYDEMRQLAGELTGAHTVRIISHLTRNEAEALEGKRLGAHRLVHNDFTPALGQKLQGFITDRELLRGRIAIFNIWRRFDPDKEDAPLAVCDARSVSPADLLPTDLHNYGGHEGFQLEIYQALHNPSHQWFFFPQMTRDEVLVFKTYDSDMDPFVPTLHSAFDHPECAATAAPRESIEARAICFFG